MKRIATLVAIILALVGYGAIATAQQPKKVPRIGYLSSGDASYVSPPVPRQFGWLCASVAT